MFPKKHILQKTMPLKGNVRAREQSSHAGQTGKPRLVLNNGMLAGGDIEGDIKS